MVAQDCPAGLESEQRIYTVYDMFFVFDCIKMHRVCTGSTVSKPAEEQRSVVRPASSNSCKTRPKIPLPDILCCNLRNYFITIALGCAKENVETTDSRLNFFYCLLIVVQRTEINCNLPISPTSATVCYTFAKCQKPNRQSNVA